MTKIPFFFFIYPRTKKKIRNIQLVFLVEIMHITREHEIISKPDGNSSVMEKVWMWFETKKNDCFPLEKMHVMRLIHEKKRSRLFVLVHPLVVSTKTASNQRNILANWIQNASEEEKSSIVVITGNWILSARISWNILDDCCCCCSICIQIYAYVYTIDMIFGLVYSANRLCLLSIH